MRARTLGLVTAVAVAAGCGPGTLAQQQSTEAEATSYYLGEVQTQTPAGQTIATSLSLARRTLKPAERRIVEVVATVEAGKPNREYATVFDIDGSKFTLKDDEGTFAGTGELTGEAWRWTGWTYEVEFAGARKGRLRGEDVLSAGGLLVRKAFTTPEGTVRVRLVEDLKPIGKAAYDILHARLLPEAKP